MSLSALLNPDSSGDQDRDRQQDQQTSDLGPQLSPSDRREDLAPSTLLQSSEIHDSLPTYTPPQKLKPGDDNGATEPSAAAGVVLAPLQMPRPEESAVKEDKEDINMATNQDPMDKVKIKQEAIASPSETMPPEARRLSIQQNETDLQSSRTLANLKQEHNSRTQSPLRESSLALPSTEDATPTTKKKPPPSRKKGTATAANKRNKVVKKRKPDVKGVDLKSGITRGSSAASPTPSEGMGEEYDEDESMADSDEDVEGSGDVYCICRKPDNGTFMIGCDGGCDDWYHGKCVSIEEKDKNLIDKYICPRCMKGGIGQTSWKRICRRAGCRQPARVGKNAGKNGATSKYCSDECGVLFFRQMTAMSRTTEPRKVRRKSGVEGLEDRVGSKGGVLSTREVRAMLDQANSAGELRDLGNGVLSPPATPSDTVDELEGMTDFDEQSLERIAMQKQEARQRHQVLKDRLRFVTMAKDEATRVAAEKDLKPKEYCGYDSRLEWSDDEFVAWRQTRSGQQAFESESLKDTIAADNLVEICSRKKCARHNEWSKLIVDDIRFETTENSDRMRSLEHEERDIRERAATRAKTRKFGVEEGKVEFHDLNEPAKEVAPTQPPADSEAMDIDVA